MTKHPLNRLLSARSLAVIGGGVWGRSVIQQCRKIGFDGDIYVVHPKADEIEGLHPYRSVGDLPTAPDAAFVGVNREATIEIIRELSVLGAGGAVCFASGFLEVGEENADGAALQEALVKAAGDMPIIGPNCYGFVNYLDRFCIWPDQHGGVPVSSGVAIITQSSNIMINLTMHKRGLPLAFAVTVGNQAQTSLSAMARVLLDDKRITALGLHIEGIGDLRDFEELAQHAARLGKPIVALKVGRSEQAQQGAISHTASLAGQDAGADALLKRLGIYRIDSLSAMIEVLKIFHMLGHLRVKNPEHTFLAAMSCSGGEAGLIADLVHQHYPRLSFPNLNEAQKAGLQEALGEMVALANPLDYHTYIWGNVDKMADTFTAMAQGPADLIVIIVDFPRDDRCSPDDWDCAIKAASIAQQRSKKPIALLSSMPENLSEKLAMQISEGGLIPLCGLEEGIAAIACATSGVMLADNTPPVLRVPVFTQSTLLDEATAKEMLRPFGIDLPKNIVVKQSQQPPQQLPFSYPVVLKALGIAHKSDMGGVKLGLMDRQALETAMAEMDRSGTLDGRDILIEEMITEPIAELLVGVVADPAHGFTMTIGAGGVLTELLKDTVSLLLPVQENEIHQALKQLKLTPLLMGYRGNPGVDIKAAASAILAIQACVIAHEEGIGEGITEIEVNPLILTADRAVAVDILIKLRG